jgi:hypothetical protein
LEPPVSPTPADRPASGLLATIVEGHSEVESVPILIRRALDWIGGASIGIARPFRVHRYQVVREGELEKAVRHVIATRRGATGLLILLDADDDCPARLGPELTDRCRRVTALPVAVVLAQTEFEAWLLGGKESLRGVRGIREDALAPERPERIREAKERLSRNMRGRGYVSVDDQPALVEKLNLDLARRRCDSFDKFCRELARISAPARP